MSKRPLVPEAQAALDKLKIESANELGIELNDSYKGNGTARANGATGGPLGGLSTKKMVEAFERKLVDK